MPETIVLETDHPNPQYVVQCEDCDEFPKVCSTEWAAEQAVSDHWLDTFGPTHNVWSAPIDDTDFTVVTRT